MADELKKILVGLQLQSKEWINEIARLRATMKAQDEAEQRREKESATAAQKQIVDSRLITSEAAKYRLETQKVLDLAKVRMAQEKVLEQQEKNKLLAIKAETDELKKQELIRKQQMPAGGPPTHGGGHGGGAHGSTGVMRSMLTGIAHTAGGGMLGSVFAGVVGGSAALAGVNFLTEGVTKLVHEIKRFIETSGPLQQTTALFGQLAQRSGREAKEFGESLVEATHGLVDDMQVMKTANKIMMQNLPITTEQIEKLFRASTDLARVQGKEVAPTLEMVSAMLLRGRFRNAQYVLGLDQRAKAELALTDKLGPQVKLQKQLEVVVAAANRQIEAAGGAQLTYTERLKQMDVATENFFESLAAELTASAGFKSFIDLFDRMIKTIQTEGHGLADWLGEQIGLIFEVVSSTAEVGIALWHAFAAVLHTVGEGFKELGTVAGEVVSSIFGAEAGNEAIDRWTSLRGIFISIAQVFLILASRIEMIARHVERLYHATKDTSEDVGEILGSAYGSVKPTANIGEYLGSVWGATKGAAGKFMEKGGLLGMFGKHFDTDAAVKDELESLDKLTKKLEELESVRTGKTKEGTKVVAPVKPTPIVDEALAQKLAALDAQLAEIQIKSTTDQIKDALKERQKDLDQWYEQGLVSLEDYVDKSKAIKIAEAQAEIDQIRNTEKEKEKAIVAKGKKGEKPEIVAKELVLERAKANAQLLSVYSKLQSDMSALDDKADADDRASIKARAQYQLQVRKETVANETKETQDDYNKRKISIDKYFEFLDQQAAKERALAIDTAILEYNTGKQTNEAKQKLLQVIDTAERKYTEDSKKRADDKADALIAQEQRVFDAAMHRIEVEEKVHGISPNEAYRSKISLTKEHIDALEQQSTELDVGSEAWIKVMDAIDDANASIYEFNKSMLTTNEEIGKTGDLFAELLGHSDKLKGIGDALKIGISGFKKYESPYGEGGGPLSDLKKSFGNLTSGEGEAADNLNDFNKALQSVVGAVGAFYDALTKPVGGAAGAMAGGVAGAQLGSMFGGPVGAAIGGGIGALLGGILGHARAVAEKEAKKLSDAFSKVADGMQDSTVKLKDTVAQMLAIRDKAQAELGGTKAGRDKLKDMLPDMNKQIRSLQLQQRDLALTLEKEITFMSSPMGWEQQIRSIDDIIKKYKDYEAAVQDVGKAQQWLTLSLQQYVLAQKRDLNQAEQSAIDNAIQLNDLLTQRNTIMSDYAKQEYDILARENVTRGRTRAQTAYDEMNRLKLERDKQLAQVNQQIELAQFRYDREKAIFAIADGRINMEMQLAQLQKQNISDDLNRLVALKGVVDLLSRSGTNITDIKSVLAMMSNSSLNSQFENQYQQQGRYGMPVYGELT